jgi:peptidoglycan/LPS O-acetylase OafA/YrhL
MFTYSGMLALSISALPGSVGFRILGSAFLRFFGKFSYGIYLYHWPALFVVRFWMVDKAVGLIPGPRTIGSALPGSVLVIVLTISMALASWYLVEKPLLKLKRFFPMFKMT